MALSKVFIHLVFQGSSEDECQSMEASHNSVVVVSPISSASHPSNLTNANRSTALALSTTTAAAPERVLEEETSSTLGRSHALDGSKGQLSREQCGGEAAKKQHGESYM